MAFQNHKSRFFRVNRGVSQEFILGPVLFSLFINDLPASLLSSLGCSLYADDVVIWFSFLSVPAAMEATQGALIRLELWFEYWCLSLNSSKCKASFSEDRGGGLTLRKGMENLAEFSVTEKSSNRGKRGIFLRETVRVEVKGKVAPTSFLEIVGRRLFVGAEERRKRGQLVELVGD